MSLRYRQARGEHDLAVMAALCILDNADLAGPAPSLVSGSLWLPRSRESRYHFSQRTGPNYNSHITPGQAYVHSHALLEEACAPRCRRGGPLVTQLGVERASAAAP